jgi:hypothetical protein
MGFRMLKTAAEELLLSTQRSDAAYPPAEPAALPIFVPEPQAVDPGPPPLPPLPTFNPPSIQPLGRTPQSAIIAAIILTALAVPVWLYFAGHPSEGRFYLSAGATLLLADAAYLFAVGRKPGIRPPAVHSNLLLDETFTVREATEDFSFGGPSEVPDYRTFASDDVGGRVPNVESASHPTTVLTTLAPTVLLADEDNPYAPSQPIIQLDIQRNETTETVPLPQSGSWVVGRDPLIAHYTPDSAGVSRAHAEWICEAGQVQVRDLGSRNGTYLNGELLVPFKSQPFGADDVMVIVQTEFRIHSKNSG